MLSNEPFRRSVDEIKRLTVTQIGGLYLCERDSQGNIVFADADEWNEKEHFEYYCWLIGFPDGPPRQRLWAQVRAKVVGQVQVAGVDD